jgi:RNA polymerase sigma factor (sigma-70 family)
MDSSTINEFENSVQFLEAKEAIANAYKLILSLLNKSLNENGLSATNSSEVREEIFHEVWIALYEDGIKKTFDYPFIQSFLIEYTRKASEKYSSERESFIRVNLEEVLDLEYLAFPQEEMEEELKPRKIIMAMRDAYNDLPDHKKEILKDTLFNGTSSKEVATKYKMNVKQILNIKSYILKILHKKVLKKIQ